MTGSGEAVMVAVGLVSEWDIIGSGNVGTYGRQRHSPEGVVAVEKGG